MDQNEFAKRITFLTDESVHVYFIISGDPVDLEEAAHLGRLKSFMEHPTSVLDFMDILRKMPNIGLSIKQDSFDVKSFIKNDEDIENYLLPLLNDRTPCMRVQAKTLDPHHHMDKFPMHRGSVISLEAGGLIMGYLEGSYPYENASQAREKWEAYKKKGIDDL